MVAPPIKSEVICPKCGHKFGSYDGAYFVPPLCPKCKTKMVLRPLCKGKEDEDKNKKY